MLVMKEGEGYSIAIFSEIFQMIHYLYTVLNYNSVIDYTFEHIFFIQLTFNEHLLCANKSKCWGKSKKNRKTIPSFMKLTFLGGGEGETYKRQMDKYCIICRIFDLDYEKDWVSIAELRQFHGLLGVKQENLAAENIQLVFEFVNVDWVMFPQWLGKAMSIELLLLTHIQHYHSKVTMMASGESFFL